MSRRKGIVGVAQMQWLTRERQLSLANLMLCCAGVHSPTSAVCILSDACPTQQQQQ